MNREEAASYYATTFHKIEFPNTKVPLFSLIISSLLAMSILLIAAIKAI